MNMSGKQSWEGRAVCPASRSAMPCYAKPEHGRAAKVLGYALALDTPEAWFAASAIWQARLTPQETAAMAVAALQATEPQVAHMVATDWLVCSSAPQPTLMNLMEDAGWWADLASPEERAAYAVACFNRFSPRERDEFRAFVEGR